MVNLKEYVYEGLADWGEDDKLNKKISKQTTKAAIKKEIIDYIFSNQPLSDFEIITNGYGCGYLTDHYPVCNYYETKNTNS